MGFLILEALQGIVPYLLWGVGAAGLPLPSPSQEPLSSPPGHPASTGPGQSLCGDANPEIRHPPSGAKASPPQPVLSHFPTEVIF